MPAGERRKTRLRKAPRRRPGWIRFAIFSGGRVSYIESDGGLAYSFSCTADSARRRSRSRLEVETPRVHDANSPSIGRNRFVRRDFDNGRRAGRFFDRWRPQGRPLRLRHDRLGEPAERPAPDPGQWHAGRRRPRTIAMESWIVDGLGFSSVIALLRRRTATIGG